MPMPESKGIVHDRSTASVPRDGVVTGVFLLIVTFWAIFATYLGLRGGWREAVGVLTGMDSPRVVLLRLPHYRG